MAVIITYPDINNANPDEWRTMIQDLEIFTGGLLLLEVAEINTSNPPVIKAGSRLDINGTRYKCTADEHVTETPVDNAVNFVYAVPNGNSASFVYSGTTPAWSAAKGGWYNGNDRAVVKLYYSSSGPVYGNKVIQDGCNAMWWTNRNYTPPDHGIPQ